MALVRQSLGRVGLWVSGAATGGQSGAGDLAKRVEALGVEALWVGGGNPDRRALQERAAMLSATEHLVVATGITNIWAWDPAELHKEASAVDRAHPGRFLLGLGVSHRPLVQQIGRNYTRPLEAMQAFLDGLDAAAAAAGGGPVPTRVLAALGPKMLELARDRAAGAHPYLVTPEHTATARPVLGEERLLAPEQVVVITTDPEAAHRIAREYLAAYLVLPNYVASLGRLGFGEDDLEGGGSDRLVDALVPSGDADAVAKRIAEHFDAGADHVCIQPLGEGRTLDLSHVQELVQALG
jgi:probable F420-dependent oxidoreductase